jgi:Ser/Thr protein kinase RdoA (MazF antagonist)
MSERPLDWQDHVPDLDLEEASDLARSLFGLEGELTPLPSDRDRNWRVRTAGGDDVVLKVSNVLEDPSLLELQTELLERLGGAGLPWRFPKPVPSVSGDRVTGVTLSDGAEHLVRAV